MGKNDSENFGKVLKELRKRENLTQESVSDLLDTDRSSIANYESGKRLPPISALIKIAEFFHVSLDFLVFGKDSAISDKSLGDTTKDELMAENTLLMEQQLKLVDELQKKEELIKIQREMLDVVKKYTGILEAKLKKLEQ